MVKWKPASAEEIARRKPKPAPKPTKKPKGKSKE